MFLKPYKLIPAEFSDVRAVVLAQRATWLDEPARDAARHQYRLLAQAGLPDADHLGFGSLRAGPPQQTDRVISVPLFVGGADPTTHGAAPAGALDTAWLAPNTTHVAIAMAYNGKLADVADRAQFHRVLEAVTLHFLDLVANRIVELSSG